VCLWGGAPRQRARSSRRGLRARAPRAWRPNGSKRTWRWCSAPGRAEPSARRSTRGAPSLFAPAPHPRPQPPPPSRTNWTRLVPPSRTNWTRLVPPSVLTGHAPAARRVSSLHAPRVGAQGLLRPPFPPQMGGAPCGAPPSPPYKVDTSRPSLRTNWTRLVPPQMGGAPWGAAAWLALANTALQRAGAGAGFGMRAALRAWVGAPPSLPYKVDMSRPSLRTNWTRLVPACAPPCAHGWAPQPHQRLAPAPLPNTDARGRTSSAIAHQSLGFRKRNGTCKSVKGGPKLRGRAAQIRRSGALARLVAAASRQISCASDLPPPRSAEDLTTFWNLPRKIPKSCHRRPRQLLQSPTAAPPRRRRRRRQLLREVASLTLRAARRRAHEPHLLARAFRALRARGGARGMCRRRACACGRPPPLPYKVDTSRPSLRTNWTRRVPLAGRATLRAWRGRDAALAAAADRRVRGPAPRAARIAPLGHLRGLAVVNRGSVQ
jgi:hypothetical protein